MYGELYSIAKEAIPSITKRMFIHFFNQAVEDITGSVRIYVKEETLSGEALRTIPARAARIERIVTKPQAFWRISNNRLEILDQDGFEVTNAEATVTYWERVSSVMLPVEDIVSTLPENAVTEILHDRASRPPYFHIADDLYADATVSTKSDIYNVADNTIIHPTGTRIVLKIGEKLPQGSYNVDLFLESEIKTRVGIDPKRTYFLNDALGFEGIEGNTWDETVIDLFDDVAMCATFLAAASSAAIIPDAVGAQEPLAKIAAEYTLRLRRKYMGSKTYETIRQVSL